VKTNYRLGCFVVGALASFSSVAADSRVNCAGRGCVEPLQYSHMSMVQKNFVDAIQGSWVIRAYQKDASYGADALLLPHHVKSQSDMRPDLKLYRFEYVGKARASFVSGAVVSNPLISLADLWTSHGRHVIKYGYTDLLHFYPKNHVVFEEIYNDGKEMRCNGAVVEPQPHNFVFTEKCALLVNKKIESKDKLDFIGKDSFTEGGRIHVTKLYAPSNLKVPYEIFYAKKQ
jgi:hypothetical protein